MSRPQKATILKARLRIVRSRVRSLVAEATHQPALRGVCLSEPGGLPDDRTVLKSGIYRAFWGTDRAYRQPGSAALPVTRREPLSDSFFNVNTHNNDYRSAH